MSLPGNSCAGNAEPEPHGQSLFEYTMLIAAVTCAIILMSDYVRRAFNAHAETIEEGLNGATDENKP